MAVPAIRRRHLFSAAVLFALLFVLSRRPSLTRGPVQSVLDPSPVVPRALFGRDRPLIIEAALSGMEQGSPPIGAALSEEEDTEAVDAAPDNPDTAPEEWPPERDAVNGSSRENRPPAPPSSLGHSQAHETSAARKTAGGAGASFLPTPHAPTGGKTPRASSRNPQKDSGNAHQPAKPLAARAHPSAAIPRARSPSDPSARSHRTDGPAPGLRAFSPRNTDRRLNLHEMTGSPSWDGSKRTAASRQHSSAAGAMAVALGAKHPRLNATKERHSKIKGSHEVPPRKPPHPGTSRRPASSSLKSLLGGGSIRPPKDHPTPPDFSKVRDRVPRNLPDGTPVDPTPPSLRDLESLTPPSEEPSYPSWKDTDSGVHNTHWHASEDKHYFHMGETWGVWSGRWSWMKPARNHWWVLADGRPLLWHEGHWWWRNQDVWFMLHDGESWAYRWFPQWERAGLVHPRTDTRILYSADGQRAAVVTPEEDSVVFDLASGEEIGRVPNSEMHRSLEPMKETAKNPKNTASRKISARDIDIDPKE